MRYSDKFKENILKQILLEGKSQQEVSLETGIGRSTIGYWLKKHRKDGCFNMGKKERRPQDWTSEERISALIETGSMTDDEKAEWCRKNGLFTHNLNQWKKDAIIGSDSIKNKVINKKKNDHSKLQKEIKRLKKELTRKDKALSETAALLVLKKKLNFLLEEEEDD